MGLTDTVRFILRKLVPIPKKVLEKEKKDRVKRVLAVYIR